MLYEFPRFERNVFHEPAYLFFKGTSINTILTEIPLFLLKNL